jgi:hypothetical protein
VTLPVVRSRPTDLDFSIFSTNGHAMTRREFPAEVSHRPVPQVRRARIMMSP